MKILDAYSKLTDPTSSATAPKPRAAEAAGAAEAKEKTSPAAITVTVSTKARELASSRERMDDAKVSRLRSAIDAGTFKVDARAIADKLIDVRG